MGNNYQGNQTQNNPGRPNNQYNSTTAPRSMNNVPVPMDLDRTWFNRNKMGNQSFRGQVLNAGTNGPTCHTPNPSTSAPCFKCGATDHWANKCPNRGAQSNLINLDLDEEATQMSINDIKERINAMTCKAPESLRLDLSNSGK